MGNVVQRLTHRGGEFRLTQVNETPTSGKPTITVTDDSTNLPQDEEDLEPNGGDPLFFEEFTNYISVAHKILFVLESVKRLELLQFSVGGGI